MSDNRYYVNCQNPAVVTYRPEAYIALLLTLHYQASPPSNNLSI